MRPGAPPKSRMYVFTGHGEVSSLVTDPPGTPGPPAFIKYKKYIDEPPSKFYVCSDFPHTHTPCTRQGGVLANEVKVRMKRGWRWDEIDDEVRNYLTGTRGGERKRRGREQTPTPTHLARSGQTLKRQGKRKTEADGQGTRPAEGGKDGSAWTNLPQRNLRLRTHRTQPSWGGKNAWNRGPNGDLVDEKVEAGKLTGIQFKPRESCVIPSKGR